MSYHYSYIVAQKYFRDKKKVIISSLETYFLKSQIIKIADNKFIEDRPTNYYFQSLSFVTNEFYFHTLQGSLNYINCPECKENILDDLQDIMEDVKISDFAICSKCNNQINPNMMIQEKDDDIIQFVFTDLAIHLDNTFDPLEEEFLEGISEILESKVTVLNIRG